MTAMVIQEEQGESAEILQFFAMCAFLPAL
jgi:hypothetical protein